MKKIHSSGQITKKSEFSKTLKPFNLTVPENTYFMDLGTGTNLATVRY